jgi:hypothetical protein
VGGHHPPPAPRRGSAPCTPLGPPFASLFPHMPQTSAWGVHPTPHSPPAGLRPSAALRTGPCTPLGSQRSTSPSSHMPQASAWGVHPTPHSRPPLADSVLRQRSGRAPAPRSGPTVRSPFLSHAPGFSLGCPPNPPPPPAGRRPCTPLGSHRSLPLPLTCPRLQPGVSTRPPTCPPAEPRRCPTPSGRRVRERDAACGVGVCRRS